MKILSLGLIGLIHAVEVVAGTPDIEIQVGDASYRVELAVTRAQRQRGLMHRNDLGPDRGMLLVYTTAGDHRVWMKNMQIALRVFWIDADYRIISHLRLEPCTETPCPIFAAPAASRFILELSDREHAIQPGDRVDGLSDL